MSRLRLLLLAASLALVVGCGVKGPPLPPLKVAPPRVNDLVVHQRGERWVLSWTAPPASELPEAPGAVRLLEVLEVSGRKLAETRARIKAEAPKAPPSNLSGDLVGPPAPAPADQTGAAREVDKAQDEDEEEADVEAEPTPAAASPTPTSTSATPSAAAAVAAAKKTSVLPTQLPRPILQLFDFAKPKLVVQASSVAVSRGFAFVELTPDAAVTGDRLYSVRYVSRSGGRSPLSNVYRVMPQAQPEAPAAAPHVTLVPGGVEASGLPGNANLYRRRDKDQTWEPRPLAAPARDVVKDAGAKVGETWCYAITQGAETESALSPESCIEVRDVFAPEAPRALVAASVEGGAVLLVWEPSNDPEVKAYHVYRTREGSEGGSKRLTEKPVAVPRFKDEAPKAGQRFRYTVTAVDAAVPPNESSPSEAAVVTAGSEFDH